MTALVYDASLADPADWPALEELLDEVFARTQEAVREQAPVVYVVHEPSLWGHTGPLRSALATALVGGMRSVAVEGRRTGLSAHVVAVDEDTDPAVLSGWVELLVQGSATGQLVTLGSTHLGRPAV